MRTVVDRARSLAAVPTVITLIPPARVLHRATSPLYATFDQKIEAFAFWVEQDDRDQVDKNSRKSLPKNSFADVVVERLHAMEVYLGRVCFGHNAKGTSTFCEVRASGWGSLPTRCPR